jgi:hypothetical protein
MKCPRCKRDFDPAVDGWVCWFCFYRYTEAERVELTARRAGGEPVGVSDPGLLFMALPVGEVAPPGDALYGVMRTGSTPADETAPSFEAAKLGLNGALAHLACCINDLGVPYTSPDLERARQHVVFAHESLKRALDGRVLTPLEGA